MRFKKRVVNLFLIINILLIALVPEASAAVFRLIALPDTQNYSQYYPGIFTSQTQWIAANKSDLSIAFVAHEGDLVNNNTTTEYNNADAAMDLLDGGDVHYATCPGNHDGTLYNSYFGASRYSSKPYFADSYDDRNNCYLFSAGGLDFVIIFLQYAPGTNQLNWADARLKEFPNRRGIVVSHSILNAGGTQTSWTTEGQNIYNALNDNPNLFLMLCGHMHGEGRRTDTGSSGNTIYSVLADYQNDTSGGNGFLRILEFDTTANQINVTTYSPYTQAYKTASSSQFTLSYTMTQGLAGDFTGDCDVDGTDLADLIADPSLLDIAAFARNFGKNVCP